MYNFLRRSILITASLCFVFNLALSQSYWQQEADYKMEIDFDVEKNQFTGKQKIKYKNNSPDTLDKIFYHLYFNAFQPNSMMDWKSRSIQDPDGRVGDRIYYLKKDEIGYHKIKSLTMDGKECIFYVEGTVLEVRLPKPIHPGKKATFEMNFDSQVPMQIRRSGRDNAEGIRYSMSQWYPKLCEYDHQGWHANPYVGREFHGIWGDFEVEINIDGEYIVAATGVQKSNNKYQKSDKKKRTWKYKAENVHDFVWAADPDYTYIYHKTDEGIDLEFFYQSSEELDENWKKLPGIMDEAIGFMNKRYGKYPYPVYKFIQGGDGGMEYPMATLITGKRSLGSLVGVSVHEWMHSWYQMVLATNEALYPWMDEGFTSFGTTETMNYLREKGMLGAVTPQENPFQSAYDGYVSHAMSNNDEPLSTHADHYVTNRAYGVASYTKGQVFLKQLEYIIGKKHFDKTLLRYYNDWKFKHPTDVDFMRVAEKVSGLELDWYREYWINTTHKIDYAVFLANQDSKFEEGLIFLSKEEYMPMPLDILVEYKDGSQEIFNIPLGIMRGNKSYDYEGLKTTIVEDWPWTNPAYSLQISTKGKEIIAVTVDPSLRLADVNRSNNFWRKTEE
jgi:hypothetical protein